MEKQKFLVEVVDLDDNMLFRSLVEARIPEELYGQAREILDTHDCRRVLVNVSALKEIALETMRQVMVESMDLTGYNMKIEAKGEVAEWPKASVSKTEVSPQTSTVGSNPTLSSTLPEQP